MTHSRAGIRAASVLLCCSLAAAAAPPDLFDRVVILGASVSAGEKAPSPGLLLAGHMGTNPARIHTFARGGAPSSRHLASLDGIAAVRPTLIVAVDLFYHDFAISLFLPNGKKRYLRDYIARLHDTGAVVVLGNVPSLVLLRHEHANDYLDELAAAFPRLVLLDVRQWIDDLEPGGIPVRTARGEIVLRRDDVFADRVHPNLLGSTLVANRILERLRERFPERLPAAVPLPLPLPVRLEASASPGPPRR